MTDYHIKHYHWPLQRPPNCPLWLTITVNIITDHCSGHSADHYDWLFHWALLLNTSVITIVTTMSDFIVTATTDHYSKHNSDHYGWPPQWSAQWPIFFSCSYVSSDVPCFFWPLVFRLSSGGYDTEFSPYLEGHDLVQVREAPAVSCQPPTKLFIKIDTNQMVTMSLFIYSRGHWLSTSEIILLSMDGAILIQKADICVMFQRVPGKPLASSSLLLNLTFGLHIQNKFITRWDILVGTLSQRWLDIQFLGGRTSAPISLLSLEDRMMKVQNSNINDRILY